MVVLPLILLFGFVGRPRFFLCSDPGNGRLTAVLGQFVVLARPTTLPKDTTSTAPSITHSQFGTALCSVSRLLRILLPPLLLRSGSGEFSCA